VFSGWGTREGEDFSIKIGVGDEGKRLRGLVV